jgi:shikimate dehydrogenase
MRAGVIGHPISHSLSPEIFKFLKARIGNAQIDYAAHDVAPEDLKSFISESSQDPRVIGFNVTLPYKEKVLIWGNHLSDEVEKIGAANVLAIKNHEVFIFNTDVIGIQDTLASEQFSLQDSTVLIIGAGGAARAALYACALGRPHKISVANRHFEKALSLVTEFQLYFKNSKLAALSIEDKVESESHDLIIQATPVGMSGFSLDAKTSNLYKRLFKTTSQKSLAFDLVYRPEITPFIRAAEQSGWKTIGGLCMLVGQALATWEIWFGPIENKEQVRLALHQHLASHLRGNA